MTHHDDTQALLARRGRTDHPDATSIVVRVCDALGESTLLDVMSGRRHAARVRHVVCLILRRRGASFPAIAAALSFADHTTAMNGCRRAAAMEAADPRVAAVIKREVERTHLDTEALRAQHREALAAACMKLISALDRGMTTGGGLCSPAARTAIVTAALAARKLAGVVVVDAAC